MLFASARTTRTGPCFAVTRGMDELGYINYKNFRVPFLCCRAARSNMSVNQIRIDHNSG